MSYLAWPRLHFYGQVQIDVSTVNNDSTHFDTARFQPTFQRQQHGKNSNGWWNPDGSGSWHPVDCRVTGGVYADGSACVAPDPVLRMLLTGAEDRVAAKLVDLDPCQQGVSEIWGFAVRMFDPQAGPAGRTLFRGEYQVAAYHDLWSRIWLSGSSGDAGLGAYYQSRLTAAEWAEDLAESRLLRELKAACPEGRLAIKFNLDGYQMDRSSPDFTLARIVGTLGPAEGGEPVHYIPGRQLLPQLNVINFPIRRIFFMPGQVNREGTKLALDFGNSLPTEVDGGSLASAIGPLDVAILAPGQPLSLGPVGNLEAGWYERTAGIQDFPVGRDLSAEETAALETSPVAVRSVSDGGATVLIQESPTGLYLRADRFVYRLYPGETAEIDLYVTRFGKPVGGQTVKFALDPSGLSPGAPPNVGEPAGALEFPASLTSDADGRVRFPLKASDPGNPRDYIDGQVYGIRYTLAALDGTDYCYNPFNFLSILVWNEYRYEGEPTWWGQVQPIFQQYANLYPVMSRILDLGDYESVVRFRDRLKLVFSRDRNDPNYMPVTRDLSPGKLRMILHWLETCGPDGKPLEGTKPAAAPEAPVPHP